MRSAYATARAYLTGAVLLITGCGGGVEADSTVEDSAARTDAIRYYSPSTGTLNDPDAPWLTWAPLEPSNAGADITHSSSPALCGTPAGFLTATVASNGSYRVLQWHFNARGPVWASYGNQAFESKPACALRDDAAPGRPGFVLAGKGSDGRIYASPGRMAAASDVGNTQLSNQDRNPLPVSSFAAVSNTVYQTGGQPALSMGGFVDSAVVLTFMGDNARTILAHFRALPYLDNSWSSRIVGPTLPAGWTAVDTPAIARLPVTFKILVRATNGSTERLFETHFYTDGTQGYFSSNIGTQAPGWSQLPSMGTMEQGPALTYSNDVQDTVYFKRGNHIMQTSGFPLGANPILRVRPIDGVRFASAPAAAADWHLVEQGSHVVVARTTSNRLRYIVSRHDDNIVP